ncbi:hypothetical protein TGDOM2_399980, partial [Toxoplasma gondii GAB2-2007-GAL-DOM2]
TLRGVPGEEGRSVEKPPAVYPDPETALRNEVVPGPPLTSTTGAQAERQESGAMAGMQRIELINKEGAVLFWRGVPRSHQRCRSLYAKRTEAQALTVDSMWTEGGGAAARVTFRRSVMITTLVLAARLQDDSNRIPYRPGTGQGTHHLIRNHVVFPLHVPWVGELQLWINRIPERSMLTVAVLRGLATDRSHGPCDYHASGQQDDLRYGTTSPATLVFLLGYP